MSHVTQHLKDGRTRILLVVNYHYVASRAPDAPRAIFPVTTSQLADQIGLLSRGFEFVSASTLVDAVVNGRALPARACLITFDDGLRSQYELALPVLERLGVEAVFFVCGRPLAERRALHVHKVHYLRELWSEPEFEWRLTAELARRRIDLVAPSEASRTHYRYDTPTAARTKYVLNVLLPPPVAEEIIDGLLRASGTDEDALVSQLYIDRSDLADLARRAAIGSHAQSHRPLARLSDGEILSELERGRIVLEAITGSPSILVSYPYGSREAVDTRTAEFARRVGYRVGFTMERAINTTLEDPLLLARLDANDVPGGRTPLLSLRRGGLEIAASLPLGRRRYLTETLISD